MLDIAKKFDGDKLTIALKGELNTNTAPTLNEIIDVDLKNVSDLTFDFAELDYISSYGICSLLKAKKQIAGKGGSMRVVNVKNSVAEAFEMTRLNSALYSDTDNAVDMNQKYYPVRPIQRWMFDTQLQHAKSTMMNVGGLYKIDPNFDIEKLLQAINNAVRDFDIFGARFVFHPQTGDLCQIFVDGRRFVTVEKLSDEEFEIKKATLRQPYYLIDEPMYYGKLFCTPSANYAYLEFHHTIMDGMSGTLLFMREAGLRYEGKSARKNTLSYRDIIDEENSISPELFEEGYRYWSEMLTDFDAAKYSLPHDSNDARALGKLSKKIPQLTVNYLRENKFPEDTFLITASLLTMAKLTNRKDAFISWVHNGRQTIRKTRVLGIMLDQFPLYWNFSKNSTVAETINEIAALQKEELTYKASLGPIYESGVLDNFICVLFQLNLYSNPIIAGLKLEAVEIPNDNSDAESLLDFEIMLVDGIFVIDIDYNTGAYTATTIENFAQTYSDVIQAMLQPEKTTDEILAGTYE